jgi:hypothetical protein
VRRRLKDQVARGSVVNIVVYATVALKNGWLPIDNGGGEVNGGGYVKGDGRDYVIAIMTYGTSEATGIATIQGLSGLIWRALSGYETGWPTTSPTMGELSLIAPVEP